MTAVDVAELAALRDARFPGGRCRIEPYENLLMHDAVRSPRSPEPHPVWAFVVAQWGMGLTLHELLTWFGSSPEDGPLLGECTLEFDAPLAVGRDYRVGGRVTGADRTSGRTLGVFDRVSFTLDLDDIDAGTRAASSTYTFLLPRRGATTPARPWSDGGAPRGARPAGPALPPREVAGVGAQEMKLLALLLRDPNPIHIDAEAARRVGLGDAPVNQGPANLAYVLSMLVEGRPGNTLRRITARFLGHVAAGEDVVAGGTITGTTQGGRGETAQTASDVWLAGTDGRLVLRGEAVQRRIPHREGGRRGGGEPGA